MNSITFNPMRNIFRRSELPQPSCPPPSTLPGHYGFADPLAQFGLRSRAEQGAEAPSEDETEESGDDEPAEAEAADSGDSNVIPFDTFRR